MTMRISTETLVVVGIIISVFLFGMICLACSLNPREILDCSFFRCCSRRRRHVDDDEPQTYETLNEFVFESSFEDGNGDEPESGARIKSINNGEQKTTMSQVFPDLLGGETGGTIGENSSNNNDNNNDRPAVNQSSNAELSEPLL